MKNVWRDMKRYEKGMKGKISTSSSYEKVFIHSGSAPEADDGGLEAKSQYCQFRLKLMQHLHT